MLDRDILITTNTPRPILAPLKCKPYTTCALARHCRPNNKHQRGYTNPFVWCLSQQGFFYMHHPTDRIMHTKARYTSREALAGTRTK